ncbi:MAG TPA: ATP-binding protein, partial [Woeseiaceae bacterium]
TGVRLRVSDTGPGIAADTRLQMAQGFKQLDSKSEGLGLGLAICHRIAEVHGAAISFPARADGGSGLVVELEFTT